MAADPSSLILIASSFRKPQTLEEVVSLGTDPDSDVPFVGHQVFLVGWRLWSRLDIRTVRLRQCLRETGNVMVVFEARNFVWEKKIRKKQTSS
ncbi:hypothetical protein BaRGS_00030034 [Batillaria attramentaria]|uniref:Uncharacterized protein n=1 Tax=Batillaria attramentaria TaxID=370345 RepID=A0ABD0JUE9_9CAEN